MSGVRAAILITNGHYNTTDDEGEVRTLGQDARPMRQPNLLLCNARRRTASPSGSGRPMSRQELADEINVCLYGAGDGRSQVGGIDSKYIGKLERGVYRWPNELYRKAFRQTLKIATDAELGFFVTRRPRQELATLTSDRMTSPLAPGDRGMLLTGAPSVSREEPDIDPDGTDWPVWFGIRLAHTLSVVHNWTGEHSDALQTLLHREMLMLDGCSSNGGLPVFETSRRQALITLATLPLLTLGDASAFSDASAPTEFFLSQCGAGLTACWHLLKGSDLDTVERLLGGYLMHLEAVARRPSKHQASAARLASQGHRISGIIALHRNHIRARELHCKQAVEYAAIAEDVGSRVSALISLASTYFYESDPVRAARIYESAMVFDADMSPLQRSRTRAELSVAYGQLGRERETLEAVEMAEQLYPEHPEHDPSHLFAEFTRASLTLEQGLAYAALARLHPQRGYQQTAAKVFARVEQAAQATVPDRIKYEIINHQASTAVLLGDLEAFEGHISHGVEGARLLGSKQRRKEVRAAWRLATEAWPAEPRLRAIGRDLMPALTSN